MFVHLHVHSPYSFLDGASDVETLVKQTADQGMCSLAITDRNSVTAAIKFKQACEAYDLDPIIGAELTLDDQSHLTLLAETKEGFSNLCRLLSHAHFHGGRLTPALPHDALEQYSDGLICLSGCRKGRVPSLILEHRYDEARQAAVQLIDWFGKERFFLELQCDYLPHSLRVARELYELSKTLDIGVVATNNCHYARKSDAFTHTLMRSVATGTMMYEIHPDKPFNSERYLKSPEQMQKLFSWCPEAISATLEIAERCKNVLPEPRDRTPSYPVPERYSSASEYLRAMTFKGAVYRHGELTEKQKKRLNDELELIDEMHYENYFLTAWDIVRWCRHKDQKIRVTGRGSVADSAVAFALTLTDVDACALGLPFARFMSRAEGINEAKEPDIDLDFPNSRRDEVFEYIEQRYRKGHVARVCTYSTFWARSAVRDCGKALGMPAELVSMLSGQFHHFLRAGEIEEAFSRPEMKNYLSLKEPCRSLMKACNTLEGLPRHSSVHSSGIFISRDPVDTVAVVSPQASGVLPIMMWDKEDAPILGINKLDILALGIHSATEDAEVEINKHITEGRKFRYKDIPSGDPLTYKVIQAGDAVGAFQAESAAERAYAAKLGPTSLQDLAAIVAQIRPGPIKSGAPHEFIAVRKGWKRPPKVPKELEEVLGPSYGLVIYQEQVIAVIAWCWNSSDAEADRFRKSLARHDKLDTMHKAKEEFVQRTLAAHPYFSVEAAEQKFEKDIANWFAYGFTHGHALSFADIAEKSTFMSVHYPAAYFAGILSNQPMGYYTPMSIATEARWRGVTVLPVDINESEDACTTPDTKTIRLGLCLVSGLRQEDVDLIVAERQKKPFQSVVDFASRVTLRRDSLENLILSGAFDKFHDGHRNGMLWALPETLALAGSFARNEAGFAWNIDEIEPPVAWDVERLSLWHEYVLTWQLTGVGPGCHPFAFFRDALTERGVTPLEEAMGNNTQRIRGKRVRVAGLNIRPHRPPSREGRGNLYTILEDEKRHLQCACRGEALENYTDILINQPAVEVEGILNRNGNSCELRIEKVVSLDMTLLAEESAALANPNREAERRDPLRTASWRMGYNVATRLNGDLNHRDTEAPRLHRDKDSK